MEGMAHCSGQEVRRERGGEAAGVWAGKRGSEGRNSKKRKDSREERPMILKAKRQTKSQIGNKQTIVCNFNIKFF